MSDSISSSRRGTRRRTRSALIAAMTALALSVAFANPAAASDPSEWDSTVVAVTDIGGDTQGDLSGVAVTSSGLIYGVDNNLHEVLCLSSDLNGDWSATTVAELPNNADVEGLTWVSGDSFVASSENTNSATSVATPLSINGIMLTSIGAPISLAPITELGGTNQGGAEGIAHLSGTEFLVVQEGVGSPAVPRLFKLDTSNNSVTFLFNLTGLTDAAGVAVEPGDTNSVWVLSEQDKEITKFDLTTGLPVSQTISVSGLNQPEGIAFTPDGSSLLVVGESAEISILQRSGYPGNLDAPTGNCNAALSIIPESTSSLLDNAAARQPLYVLAGLTTVTAAVYAHRRKLDSH